MRLFKANTSINNRIIDGSAIISALEWAQKTVAEGGQLPEDGLQIYGSEIVTSIDFSELEPTELEELPPEIRQHYQGMKDDFGTVDEVIMIPNHVSIRNTIITMMYANHVVFQRGIDVSASTFNNVADFKYSTFQGWADFGWASLRGYTRFDKAEFMRHSTFDSTTFESEVFFSSARFLKGAGFLNSVFNRGAYFNSTEFKGKTDFGNVKFKNLADFSQARIRGTLYIHESVFDGDVFFVDLNKGLSNEETKTSSLILSADTFSERLYFANTKIDKLLFFTTPGITLYSGPDEDEDKQINEQLETVFTQSSKNEKSPSREAISPDTINKRAVFTGLECNSADFTEVEFRDFVDFSKAKFSQHVNFNRTIFESDVNFYGTEFPLFISPSTIGQADTHTGLDLTGVLFHKPSNLEWDQINGKIISSDIDTWSRIENTFKQSGNLEGQNEAMYQRKSQEGAESKSWSRLTNRFECWFWGYGVRPLRVVVWALIIFAVFTLIYWTQIYPTGKLSKGEGKLKGAWERLKIALGFSWRTSWTIGYGYEHARTPLYKILTIIHSVGFKVLLFFVFKAFSNTSPLLNELVGKLIRI